MRPFSKWMFVAEWNERLPGPADAWIIFPDGAAVKEAFAGALPFP
jgi:hypothetical protein